MLTIITKNYVVSSPMEIYVGDPDICDEGSCSIYADLFNGEFSGRHTLITLENRESAKQIYEDIVSKISSGETVIDLRSYITLYEKGE